MAQLGEVRCASETRRARARAGAGVVAAFVVAAASAQPSVARAQGVEPPAGNPPVSLPAEPPPPEPAPSSAPAAPPGAPAPSAAPAAPPPSGEPAPPAEDAEHEAARLEMRAREDAECKRQLAIAETAIERDGKYARNWTDAWYVTGASLIALNLTNDFLYKDYRLSEAITFTALSALLMIQLPTATTNARALQGIRAHAAAEPCLALNSAKYILQVNTFDADLHQTAFAYIFPVAINVLAGGILALATQHWDFAGHGAEGLSALVGIVAGELQVLTYPRPSLKPDDPKISLHVTGTSLVGTF